VPCFVPARTGVVFALCGCLVFPAVADSDAQGRTSKHDVQGALSDASQLSQALSRKFLAHNKIGDGNNSYIFSPDSLELQADPECFLTGRMACTICVTALGLMIASSGGIGGGGILVPVFILVLGLHTKHAIALSNITIVGGAIANTMVNCRKCRPDANKGVIDWDIIVMMEPLTIFGALLGSLLSKVLPNIVLTVMLLVILFIMSFRTLKKGLKMWRDEHRHEEHLDIKQIACTAKSCILHWHFSRNSTFEPPPEDDIATQSASTGSWKQDCPYHKLPENDIDVAEDHGSAHEMMGPPGLSLKIGLLTLCFVGTSTMTILKGSGSDPSPLGIACGTLSYWVLYLSSIPWVACFAIYFRHRLVKEQELKNTAGHRFLPGEICWDAKTTVKFPLLCSLAGLMAGMFGVGGGIVKGPLLLEMGVSPVVSSATSATMILYTSASATVSFAALGMLSFHQSLAFFLLGFFCTLIGQTLMKVMLGVHERQSLIVFSIGSVLVLSGCLIAVHAVADAWTRSYAQLLSASRLCSA